MKLFQKFFPKKKIDTDFVVLKEDIDYQYLECSGISCVRLLTGDFINTIVSYKNAYIQEVDGNAVLNFDYDVYEYFVNVESDKFKEYLGHILLSIIYTSMEKPSEQEFDIEPDYFEEP